MKRLASSKQGSLDIPLDLWRQLIRDFEGRWVKYAGLRSSVTNNLYFYGHQPKPIYRSEDQKKVLERYIEANLETRELVVSRVLGSSFRSVKSFIGWVFELHRLQSYKGNPEELHRDDHLLSQNHTEVIRGDVVLIARHYRDPYAFGKTHGPGITGIPATALPYDRELSYEAIYHFYPSREYFGYYYEELHRLFRAIQRHSTRGDNRDFLEVVARFYQVAANLHMFERVNNSLYMNLVNTVLGLRGISGIEHGILDFVAMRLSSPAFVQYFADEVQRVNPTLDMKKVTSRHAIELSRGVVFQPHIERR